MEMEPEIIPEVPVAEVPPAERPPAQELTILDLTDLPDAGPEDSVGEDQEDRRRRKRVQDGSKAKTAPPSADEWQDFIGLTVLRMLTEGYLQLVLYRQIDESELTERERELVKLTKDDLRDMAAPMASFANKNKFARKHGRSIIAAADSYEAMIDLFIWMRRVNRIAKRHRPTTVVEDKPVFAEGEVIDNGTVSGPNGQTSTGKGPREPGSGFSIFNRGTG